MRAGDCQLSMLTTSETGGLEIEDHAWELLDQETEVIREWRGSKFPEPA